MVTFSIGQWRAWAPEMRDGESWMQWAQQPYCPLADHESPQLDFLTAVQRRRLSPMARMVFDCAWPLATGRQPMPLVFASQHGETTRSFALLQAMGRHEGLSPTSFGLSVHDAVAGLWSKVSGDKIQSIALSVNSDGLEQAFLEAAFLLRRGARSALVVLAEERPPPAYMPWIYDVPFSYAVAFRVERGMEWGLELCEEPLIASGQWSNTLNFVQRLCLGSTSVSNPCEKGHWRWTRNF
ncbi:3-oxoacyl-ACP synthase [Candidimonas sp. SYP-B2681]|uniref:beta-ketoacyl synthase chain length factor n=1 Tax=Candidimonas sp. SYP-B2681 TaxID=2497686 RepID=UPI000F890F21|nr:beta-ketoacyl synthase chain length factor [Candidimonas sp. SYP-B2681]RTZ41659.1 3-oxoacyl-ACP synthase [Candidimonas sp. SYP-B2681]